MTEIPPDSPKPEPPRPAERATRDPWVGRRVGRTKLKKLIAAGRRGRVYLAGWFDASSDERLAVRLLGAGSDARRLLKRFASEREPLTQLVHPHIARLLDAGTTRSGQLYWVTQYVDGVRIDRYCSERNLDLETRLRLFLLVCEAVQFAHDRSIVHGVLGPENILVDAAGQPQLLDFGMAMLLTTGDDGDAPPTATTDAGQDETAARPPVRAAAPLAVSTDVRALASLLHDLRLGAVGSASPDVAAALDTVLGRALHAHVEAPFASVHELSLAVRASLAGTPTVTAQPPAAYSVTLADVPHSPPEPPTRPRSSASPEPSRQLHRLLWFAAGAAVLLVVAGLVLAWGRWQTRDDSALPASAEMAAYRMHLAAAETAIRNGRVAEARQSLESAMVAAPDSAGRHGWEWVHLWARLDRSLVSLRAHATTVTGLAFGAEDRLVATCAEDRTIKLWDSTSGELVRSLGPLPSTPLSLAMHPSLEMVAVGCDSGTVVVVDRDNQVRARLQDAGRRDRGAFSGRAPTVQFDPSGTRLATGFCGGDVVLWEVPSFRRLSRWRLRNDDNAPRLAFAPDGKRLVLGSAAAGSTIRIWDLDSPSHAPEIGVSAPGLLRVAFGSGGDAIVGCSMDGTVQTWSDQRQEQYSPLRGHRRFLGFDHSGAVVFGAAADSADQRLEALDLSTGRCRALFVGHAARIRAVAVSADGARLASVDAAGTLKIWDARTQDVRTFDVPGVAAERHWAADIASTPDGSWIVSTAPGRTGAVELWNVPQDHHEVVSLGDTAARCVDVSPDAAFAVVGHAGGDVTVLDFGSGNVRWRARGHAGDVRAVDVAPDGRSFATGGDDSLVRVWDVQQRRVVQQYRGHAGAVLDVAYAPGGTCIVSSAMDGTLRIWDARAGKLSRVLHGHGSVVHAVAVAPDGRCVASAAADGTVRLWDVDRDEPTATLRRQQTPLLAVAFSADGTRLAAAGTDGIVTLFDPRRRCEVVQLHGHTAAILALVFDRGDGSLLSTAQDGTIRCWDAGRGVAGLEPLPAIDRDAAPPAGAAARRALQTAAVRPR